MTKTDKIVLELIRKALDMECSIDTNLFVDVRWAEVIEVATTQGVLGLCFEAIEVIDATYRPDMDYLMDMFGQVEYMRTCYEEHKKAIEELARFYADNGVKMMLLKGYGLSLYWPTPEHRPVGDIDIYLGHLWLFGDQMIHSKLGVSIDISHEHHTTFSYEGIMVENHYDFINVKAHKDASKIEAKLKELAENLYHDPTENPSKNVDGIIDGVVTNAPQNPTENPEKKQSLIFFCPSADFNVIFLIRHLGQHFAGERVTLRQLLDWGLFMQKEGESINWSEIVPFLKEMGIWTFFCHINALCNDAFGLNITVPEFHAQDAQYKHTASDDAIDKNLVNRILEDILHPEFYEEKPQGLFPVLWFKMKRWWSNRWKHPLVYNEWLLPMFLTLLWSHIRRIDTIKD